MAYSRSSIDVCVSGIERLRNRSEFLLVASISAETSLADLRADLLRDIQCCDRFAGFDYDEASRVVHETCDALAQTFARPNPFNLEPFDEDDDSYCGVNFYLYIDTGEESEQ